MTHDERERAEALVDRLDSLAREYDEYEFGLSEFPQERAKYIAAVLAFAREERARAYEQMRTVLMESEEFDYYLDWISDQITKLREEGRGDE